jgi:pilus assembly protein Flp/PilA
VTKVYLSLGSVRPPLAQPRRHLRPWGKAPQHDESGATAIEYGLIAVGISVAAITVLNGVGTKLGSTFTSVQNALN